MISFEPIAEVERIRAVVTHVCSLNDEEISLVLSEIDKFMAFAPIVDSQLFVDRREDTIMFREVVQGLLDYRRMLKRHEHNYGR